MSLTFVKGDMFASKAKILVNAVNCVGVMGGGLAAAFKKKYPLMYADYAAYCQAKKLMPGGIHVYINDAHKHIFNVATKDDWRQDSQYEWVVSGLKNIAHEARQLGERTVAVPALGCGLGGLEWDRVKKIIEEVAAEHWTRLDAEIYEPY